MYNIKVYVYKSDHHHYFEGVTRVEFIYPVYFTRMPGEKHRRRLGSGLCPLCLCDAFRALINSLIC